MAGCIDLGGIGITTITDGWAEMPNAVFPGFDPDLADAPATGRFRHHILAFVVRDGATTLLVDTGSAGNFGPDAGRFGASLAAAGIAPGAVDAVLLTHLHSDHYGGLTTQAGDAVFARARLLVAAEEWRNVHDPDFLAAVPEAEKPVVLQARKAVGAYAGRVELVRDGDALGRGMTALALPGHTPGHMGLEVVGATARAMVIGDLIHCGRYQAANPNWSTIYDHDPACAARTRIAAFSRAAQEDWLMFGAHLGEGQAHRVHRSGAGFRLQAIQ